LGLGYTNDFVSAKGGKEVHEGDKGLDFGGLAFRASTIDTLAKTLQALHLHIDPSNGMVADHALPQSPARMPDRAQGFVLDPDCRATLFPGSAVLA
jgi:hypothetical protein